MNEFYRRIKLKAHFRNSTKVKEQIEAEIFKKPTNKKWAPNKNHHTIEIFIEATKNRVKDELKTIQTWTYTDPSKKEQKSLKELKRREDIVITNAEKVGAAIMLDLKDYTKEA